MQAVVIKNISNLYTISSGQDKFLAMAQGKLKSDKVVVGDKVEYKLEGKKAIITKILPRKNVLIRPNIANIDNLVIVLSPVPEPDFLLIDKLILTCLYNDIKPILCVNKEDIDDKFIQKVKSQYSEVVLDIISLSALNNRGLDALRDLLKGKISAFAGQSAVGKSTILNSLLDFLAQKTGGISQKTGRGRHTTRHNEMFEIAENTYIIDTPGFSILNIGGITYDNLKFYYPDFADYKCKYSGCTHTGEDKNDCAVKLAVYEGKLDKDRVERYNILYKELKDRRYVYEKD